MIHRPFLRSAIQVVGDFRIGDFDLQSPGPPQGFRAVKIHFIVSGSAQNL